MDYLAGEELHPYLQQVKAKPTKKKPMHFERLNMVIMTILKYFESEMVTSNNK